ncbi:MAG: zinc ABC transporter permease subunit ZnuB [Alphaproteobacteria bacterium]
MLDDFIVRALLAGLGVAVVGGPLGCFIVWRRMAYFGDSLAHAALLGVALGLTLHVAVNLGILVVCVSLALLIALMERQRRLATDTLLGIMSHASLSIGLVTISLLATVRVDLMAYLFGDILAVMPTDLAWIYGGGAVALAALLCLWRPLLAITAHADLAQAEGVNVQAVRLAFMLLIALVIAISMKIVGIVLITSLLIIPAAAARRLSRTPEQMAVAAALIGCVSVAAGIWGSFTWDTPSGPSIVVAATILFALGLAAGELPRLLGRSSRS